MSQSFLKKPLCSPRNVKTDNQLLALTGFAGIIRLQLDVVRFGNVHASRKLLPPGEHRLRLETVVSLIIYFSFFVAFLSSRIP